MVKKILFFLMLFSLSSLFSFSLEPYQTKIIKLEGNEAIVPDSPQVNIGSSGIVIHNFDTKHRTIITKAVVTKKEGGNMYLKLYYYKDLNMDALPSYKIVPKVGDTVIFNYLYKRILPIVPNKEAFEKFKNEFPRIDVIHPDLFAYELAVEDNPAPKLSDFRKECNNDDFGLLFFALSDQGYFVDCTSFKVIGKLDFPTEGKKEKPFYTRIKNIKPKFFGLGSDEIKDFDSYYKKLLGIK